MKFIIKAWAVLCVTVLIGCSDTGGNTFGGGAGGGSQGSVDDPTSEAYFEASVGDRVFFAVDESVLSAQARDALDGQATWLNSNADYTVIIEGHADEQGTREYNLALGDRRANSARDYLLSRGVNAGRVKTVSYGKERPSQLCSDESCYSQNRRAVTVLVAGQ